MHRTSTKQSLTWKPSQTPVVCGSAASLDCAQQHRAACPPTRHLLPVPCRDRSIPLHCLHFIHSLTALSIKATKCLVDFFLMKNKCLQAEMADEKHQPARCPAPSSEEVAKMQHSLFSPTLTLQRLSGGGGRANGSCWRDRWENRTQRGKETA